MAEHNVLGKAGEDAAVKYLEKHDYVIKHRNWRRGHLELDIVEVKTRSNTEVQEPYEAVDGLKRHHIIRATDAYIKEYALDCVLRFDIITLVGDADHFQIEHIKDAFYLI